MSDQSIKNLHPVSEINTENKSDFSFQCGSNGTFRQIGPSLCKFLKADEADCKGKRISEFLHPKFIESTSGKSFLESVEKKSFGQEECCEIVFTASNGFPLALWGRFSEADKNGGVSFQGVDITPIWQELNIRTEIMNLTSIVSEANLRGDIMNVNSKFIEVSKYSLEELIGKPHNTTRHPDMPKEVFKEMWATIGKGNIFRGVVKNRAKDGTPYYVDAVIAPVIGSNGKPRK